MNSNQENKLDMFRAVVALLTVSSPLIATVAALVTKFGLLKGKMDKISVLAATQALPAAGAVVGKKEALDAMVLATLDVAGSVLSYATPNGLPELAAKVTVTESALRYGRQQDRVTLAQQVHDAAATVVARLGDYNVTAATLEDLQTKIVTATAALSGPRNAVDSRSAATTQLPEAFKEVDTLLAKEIDPLIVKFKKTQPDFYNAYQAARIIVDRPGGHAGKEPATPNAPTTPGTPPATT